VTSGGIDVDALILAAGLGTRLGEIGRDTPKALIEVGGFTMLEHAARTLTRAGADRLIVNVHHHADRITAFIESTKLGAETRISVETDRPLETGGALVHARAHFRGDAPFLLYNVDILTDADLAAMYAAHVAGGSLATLAVGTRPSRRRLLFDEIGLYGRTDERRDLRIEARPSSGDTHERSFAGIHVISPALLDLIEERGHFSILEPYLRLAGVGHRISEWSIDGSLWVDIGTPERLADARRVLSSTSRT
jgi:MurNAc alpha-1-phosphate uridylyltransferase